MDEERFVADLVAGEPSAITEARAWIRAGFGAYRTRLAADLEDIEQEILIDLTRALRDGRFQGQCRLRTYVSSFTHHKCIDRLRAIGRRDWMDLEDLELPSRAPSPLDDLVSGERIDVALRIVQEMPEECRELWRMLEQGMRYREMSQRLGVAEGTLRARVLRCRRKALDLRREWLASSGASE